VCRAKIVIIIYNPEAGRRRTRVLWRVLDILSANGVRVQLAETCHAGHAAVLAREAAAAGARLIVAAGGDGTIAEVAGGINGSGAALGVIPLGTANVLARELGLPFSAPAIAAALAFRRTRTLWPGMARLAGGDRLFVQMLGVGLDAQVVHRMPLGLKRVLGRNAYVAQTLREMLRYAYRPIRIRIDGKVEEAGSVVVTKGSLYAGQYLLAPGARPGERGFSVALFGRTGPGAVLMYGAALTMNLLPSAPGMRLLRAREVDILEGPAVLAQADGDPAGGAPIAVRDAASAIEVVVS
jgi:YegS/Rv2252/BmrU family lipid kinase